MVFKLCGNAEWKLCISIKFSNQKIRWNYGILCSVIKWREGKWYCVCWLIALKRYLPDLRIISFLFDQSLFTQFCCFFTQYFCLQRHEADVFRCMLTFNLAKTFLVLRSQKFTYRFSQYRVFWRKKFSYFFCCELSEILQSSFTPEYLWEHENVLFFVHNNQKQVVHKYYRIIILRISNLLRTILKVLFLDRSLQQNFTRKQTYNVLDFIQ